MTYLSADPTYPYFQIFSFIAFLLSLVPLPWHFQAWNAGTCAFMIWTAFICLVQFVNSIVWSTNVDNVAPVWCDISSQIILGAGIGIPASALCISRRLYTITSVQTVSVTYADKRKAVLGDLGIAVGIPTFVLLLHTIVQPHRFDILEGVGCYPPTYNTLPAYFLYYMWPPLLGLISFTYSALTLRSFWIRRAQFSQLVSSNSAMSISRYFRLMLLAIVDMMCTIPLSAYVIYLARGNGLRPWISWEDTHFDFGHINKVPALLWVPTIGPSIELTRWLSVFCAFVFFALFGFANEARRHYRLAFLWVAKRFGYVPPAKKVPKQSLPSWVATPKSEDFSAPPPTYSPGPLPPKIPRLSAISTFKPDMDFKSHDRDVEKEAGLSPVSAPPQYLHQSEEDQPTPSTSDHFSFRPSASWVSLSGLTDATNHSSRPASFTSISDHDTFTIASTFRHSRSTLAYDDENCPRAV